MKKLNLKNLAITSTLLTGAGIVALDLTPDSWKAHAMSKSSQETKDKGSQGACAEGKCAAGKCAGNVKKEDKPVSATDESAAKKDSKAKGSEHACGEGKCG